MSASTKRKIKYSNLNNADHLSQTKSGTENQIHLIRSNRSKVNMLKFKRTCFCSVPYLHSLSQSLPFLLLTMLFDELSCTLREEEHLLEDVLSVMLFSFLADLGDCPCPEDKS